MHRCFYVEEIVELIAAFAGDGRYHGRPPASLARTCRSFYDPICNLVWRKLDSFVPLLALFVMRQASDSSIGVMSREDFTHASVVANWSRYMHHARRVRLLAGSWRWHHIAYLKVLYQCRQAEQDPLLPGLRYFTFEYPECTPDSLFPLHAFVHSGLLSLNIICSSSYKDTVPSLEFLVGQMPLLEDIDVRFFGYPEQLSAAIASMSTLLCNCKNLSYVTYNTRPLPPAALRHLAQLPRLKNLNAMIDEDSCSLLSAQENDVFPALRNLWLICSVSSVVTDLFQAMRTTQLEGLLLCLYEQPTSMMMLEWTTWLARRSRFLQLDIRLHPRQPASMWGENILEHLDEVPNGSAAYQLDDNVFRPLLCLGSLTRLVLRELPLKLNDQFASEMATSWRQLRELVLGVNNPTQTTGITLEGLKTFSVHNPELWVLGVAVKTPPAPVFVPRVAKRRWFKALYSRQQSRTSSRPASTQEFSSPLAAMLPSQADVDVTIASRPGCPRLRGLAIGTSSIPNPDAVASFVSQYFPDVVTVAGGILWSHEEFSYHGQFQRVNKLISEQGGWPWAGNPRSPYQFSQLRTYLSFPGRSLSVRDSDRKTGEEFYGRIPHEEDRVLVY